MSYERESRRLEALLQEELISDEEISQQPSDGEAESDNEPENPSSDHIPNTDSEEDLSDREISENNNSSFYLGKDKTTKWNKEPYRQSGRTRTCNIVTQLPGPKRAISAERDIFQRSLGIIRPGQ